MEDVQTTDPSQEVAPEGQASTDPVQTVDSPEGQADSQDGQSDSDVSPELSKFDVNELPPELQQKYKEMQAAFTKDKQSIADLKRRAEELDRIEQEQLLQSKFPQPQAQASSESTDLLAEALGVSTADLEPAQRQQLEQLAKIVDHAAKKRVEESIRPIQNDLLQKDYESELDKVRAKFSDFDEHKGAIRDKLKTNPKLSYEEAYMLATWENQSKKGRTEALKNLESKEKQSQPKTTSSAHESDNPKGFDEIFNWAKSKQK
jgi:hypothetical protein